MGYTEHRLAISFKKVDEKLSVRRFSVQEALSDLWSVSVLASTENHDLPLSKIIGEGAGFRLTSNNPTMPTRIWAGMVEHCELLHAMTTPGKTSQSTYFFHLVPLFWRTTQRRNKRIFQRISLPDIVKALLDDWKLEADWRLTRGGDWYKKHDYVVQYGESDYAFIRRLLEEAGITFLFEFSGATEPKLVFTDDPATGRRRKTPIVAFDEPPSAVPPEFAERVRVCRTVQPGKVRLRDYEFRRRYDDDLTEESKEKVKGRETYYEHYEYAPGQFLVDSDKKEPKTPRADDKGIVPRHDEAEGKRQAELALQAMRKHKRRVRYETSCPDLAPGMIFSFDGHPREDLDEKDLLSTRFFLEGSAEGNWTFGGDAHYVDYPWVPDRETDKPRILGMQSAFVVGPEGQEIHTDEHGRVRVQFHWDRQGKYDDKSSRWCRVSQDWAGAGFGSFMLPRVGHEVLVGFYDGDPDMPVVVGRVHNRFNEVPYDLPKHKTRSTFKSDSTPKGDGLNEIMMEDKKGEELFYLQAERDLDKLVKKYETERTAADHMQIVGKTRETVVGSVEATMVGKRYLMQVIDEPSEKDLAIQEQDKPSVSATDTAFDMVNERVIFTTGKATVAFDRRDIRIEASGTVTIKAKGADCILEGKKTKINSGSPKKAPRVDPFNPLEPGDYVSPTAEPVTELDLAIEWADDIASSVETLDPAEIAKMKNEVDARVELLEKNYEKAMDGELELPEHISKERLKLAVEGGVDGVKVPLNWESREQFEQFKKELEEELAAAGITDAKVYQLGSACTGWQGNPKKVPPKNWSPASDADFAIYSPQALAQCKEIDTPYNKKVVMGGEYSILKNGTPDNNGFDDTPAGGRLAAFSKKWNKKLYGKEDVDGVDFKLNLADEEMPMTTRLL